MKHHTIQAFFIVVLSFNCYNTNAKELPSYIKKCNPHNLEFNKCLKENIEIVKPYLIKGIPEMKLPPIEPLKIPKLQFQTGTFTAIVTDINIYGIKDFEVRDFFVDMKKNNVGIHFFFPNLYGRGNSKLTGKVLLFELNNDGSAHVNITGLEVKAQKNFTLVEKKAKHHGLLMDRVEYDGKYSKTVVNFENIFQNQQLMEEINKAINDNLDEVAKELKPLMYETFLSLFSSVMQGFLDECAFEDIYEGY